MISFYNWNKTPIDILVFNKKFKYIIYLIFKYKKKVLALSQVSLQKQIFSQKRKKRKKKEKRYIC